MSSGDTASKTDPQNDASTVEDPGPSTNRTPTQQQDDNHAPPSQSSIRDVFDQVVILIRETPVTPDLDKVPNDQKLRLYGLYKHATNGPCTDPTPAIFRIEAYAKHQAYMSCAKLTPEEAMREYIRVAARQPNWLGQRCQELFQSFNEQQQQLQLQQRQTTPSREPLQPASVAPDHDTKESSRTAGGTTDPIPFPVPASTFATRLAKTLGVTPLIPRGQLDVTLTELVHTAWETMVRPNSTCAYRRIEQQIQQHCQTQVPDRASIVVGLAVRSLLDLYLTVQRYPPGAQIVVTPPLSVPGMLHVFQHHGITVIPVDFPLSVASHQTALAIDVEAVKQALTNQTVAIMVVHPFGMSCTQENWTQLRALASHRKIHLLEDAAECYTGNLQSTVNADADVSFVSFGLIKTATALGGGVAIVQDSEMARAMDRVQWGVYTPQSQLSYLRKIIKASLLLLASTPVLYGWLAAICAFAGLNFDIVVTNVIRSFSNPSSGREQMRMLRQRPTSSLLAFLLRRLSTCTSTVKCRVQQCHYLSQHLNRLATETVAYVDAERSTFWLFPLVSKDPEVLRAKLRAIGIDSTRGMSQLQCLSSTCHRAASFMQQILYIPSTGLSADDVQGLLRVVQLCEHGVEAPFSEVSKVASTRTHRVHVILFCSILCFSFWSVVRCIQVLSGILICVFVFMVVTGLLLQWSMGDYYVQSSNCLARFSGLLSDRLNPELPESMYIKHDFPIASSTDSLKVPSNQLENSSGVVVMVTGATGFIGSMLLRDLLFHQKALSIRQIMVLCRPKRGVSAVQRIDNMLQSPEFEFLGKDTTCDLIKVVEGDVTLPNAGLSHADLAWVCGNSAITHIFHCAASVSFTQTLEEAARTNIFPALELQKLAASLTGPKPVKFIHVSTSFVHGSMTGSETTPLSESLYLLGNHDPASLYDSMRGTQFYAANTMRTLGFHNTYTFSKCICEHLLSRYRSNGVATIIMRPTIVGPSLENPYEGWAGSKPSTLVAAACLYLAYQWNLWSFGDQTVPCIPVDIVTRFMLSKAFEFPVSGEGDPSTGEEDLSTSDGSFEQVDRNSSPTPSDTPTDAAEVNETKKIDAFQIFNVAWDSSSPPSTSFTWLQYAVAVTQVGSLLGSFGRPTALFGLFVTARLLPKALLTLSQFEMLHFVLVQTPFRTVQSCLSMLKCDTRALEKLGLFLDLPLLFYPFMNETYFFQSQLVAPTELDGSRYLFSCTVAAAHFTKKAFPPSEVEVKRLSFLSIGGSSHRRDVSDIWWACTQPRGSLFFRLGGYFMAKLFRAICSQVTVDVPSFAAVAAAVHAQGKDLRLVLVPTHRSFLDFITIGFLLFSLPELQIPFPIILAADEFDRLPLLGFLARRLLASFVQRGRKNGNPGLKDTVRSSSCIEVFIEGSRSRDRRFLQPKSGFLTCLLQEETESLVVPITVNYEAVPEQFTFVKELETDNRPKMTTSGLVKWLNLVWRGEVKLGRIHVAACDPIKVNRNTMNHKDARTLGNKIQQRQRSQLLVSSYHLEAASRVLNIDPTTLKDALVILGCKIWPQLSIRLEKLDFPNTASEQLTLLLQGAPFFALAVKDARPTWAHWLDHDIDWKPLLAPENTAKIGDALVRLFDEADNCADAALRTLKGLGYHRPALSHALQVAQGLNSSVPSLLLLASLSFSVGSDSSVDSRSRAPVVGAARFRLSSSNEALGYWGYHDSSFVVKVGASGNSSVTMKGSRYPLCSREVTQLLPFIEAETQTKINLLHEYPNKSHEIRLPTSALSQEDLDLIKANAGDVSGLSEDRVRHGTGHCQEDICLIRSGHPARMPDVVVWPTSEDQVMKLVDLALVKSWCLIPFGGGTNVSQSVRCPPLHIEPRPILSVDLRRMNRILSFDEENGLAHVESGILGSTLVEALAKRGYTMGHEPDSIEFSTVGGWIATNASGMKRSKYGNIEDIVKNVTVCTVNGISRHGSQQVSAWGRESTNLRFADLLLGSEGCLGILTSAVIRVHPLPEVVEYDGLVFSDFETGLSFVRDVARLEGLSPASIRLLDNAHFRLGRALTPTPSSVLGGLIQQATNLAFQQCAGFDWKQAVCATIVYEGDRATTKAQKQEISRLSTRHGGVRMGAQAGKSGYDLTFMIAYLRDFALTYHFLGESFETFAPWSRVRSIVQATKDRIYREHASRSLPGRPFVGCRVTQLYHEGVCLYFYLCINIENVERPSETFVELERLARREILQHGGSLSHHHGVGKVRSQFLSETDSPALTANWKAIKKALDPSNVFGARNGVFADEA